MLTQPTGKATAALPDNVLEALADGADSVKVESLVQDFLSAQSLKVLPQGPFGDAVNQFVSKDDKHAMELFVSEHLTGQVKQLLGLESDDEDLNSAMEIYRTRIEQQVTSGPGRGMFNTERKRILKPKPDTWDSDFDGSWEDEPGAWTYEAPTHDLSLTTTQEFGPSSRGRAEADAGNDDMSDDEPAPKATKRSTARGRKAATATKKAPARKAPAKGRGHKAVEESEEEEEDVVMESDDEPPPPPKPATRGKQAATTRSAAATATKKTTTRGAAKSKQTKLDFSQKGAGGTQKSVEISDDEISDEDDAFEPAPPVTRRTRRR